MKCNTDREVLCCDGNLKHLSCEERTMMIRLSLEQGCKLRAMGPQLASRAEFDQPRIAP
ncbi:MAG: hypothetical protein VB125_02815 [Burkholderia sp.]